VSDRSISCSSSKKSFLNLDGVHFENPYYDCTVSFTLNNVTSKVVDTHYVVKNTVYEPTNKIQGGRLRFGFIESGDATLRAKEIKKVTLVVLSSWSYEALKVETSSEVRSI